MHGAALVPAWIDAAEAREARAVGALDAAHSGPVLSPRAEARVDAQGVRMPDVDGGAHDRAARGRVDDLQAEQQRHARPALRDVPAPLLAGDVVRALRLA